MVTQFTEDFLSQDGKILVKFGAPWCGPCRQLAPIIEAMVEDGYKVYEVNTDEAQDLAVKYGIRSLPTTLIFENGEVINTLIGLQNKADLIAQLN